MLECGAVSKLRLRATRSEGLVPEVRAHATDTQEAQAIAQAIARGHSRDTPWSHHAVLARTNAQAVLLAESLRAIGAPVRVRGQTRFLQLPEVREALGAMRRSRAGFRDALVDVEVRVPQKLDIEDVGDEEDDDEDDVGLLFSSTAMLSDAELARIRNLEELVRLANEYLNEDRSPSAERSRRGSTPPSAPTTPEGAATRSTSRPSTPPKGSSGRSCISPGSRTGSCPSSRRRPTRPRPKSAGCSTSRSREPSASCGCTGPKSARLARAVARRRPSPYLEEIEPVLDAMRRGRGARRRREHLPAVRETVRSPPSRGPGARRRRLAPGDQVLFEELRRWRSQQAKAASVPAFVIFDDKTLTEVAARRPTDKAGLLAVPGIGPVKLERYGDDLLAVVAGH